MTAIRFVLMLVGAEMCGFSARFVSEGHPVYVVGVAIGTALMFAGLVLHKFTGGSNGRSD